MKYTRKGESAKRKMRKNKSRVTSKKGGANFASAKKISTQLTKQTQGTIGLLREKNSKINGLEAQIADLKEKIEELKESEKQSQVIIVAYEADNEKLREDNEKLKEDNRKLSKTLNYPQI